MSYWIAGAATVGALTDRKKPLRGALMGAGVGATGGAAAGAFGGGGMAGLFGGGAAAGGGTAAGAGAGTAGFGLGQPLVTGGLGSSAVAGGGGSAAAGGGMMDGLLGAATKYKPLMDAASTGLAVGGAMGGNDQPMQVPEMQQVQGGNQALASLANQGQQTAISSIQSAEQERAKRRAARGFA